MIRIGRATCVAAAILVSSLANAAEDAAAVDTFARIAGTWKMQMNYVESAHSKARQESMTVRNDCWHSDFFYVCNQIIDDKSRALIVFFYDPVAKRYGSYPIAVGADTVHPTTVVVNNTTVINRTINVTRVIVQRCCSVPKWRCSVRPRPEHPRPDRPIQWPPVCRVQPVPADERVRAAPTRFNVLAIQR